MTPVQHELPGKDALVTGGGSGVGFAAAALLADAGCRRVVVACRSEDKAERACSELTRATGQSVFHPLAIDVADLESVRTAVRRLTAARPLDLLLLNAGVLPGSGTSISRDGIEETTAVSVAGHHALTMRLLRARRLAAGARIVISGSEGARGDAPGMKPLDLAAFADEHFDGDLEKAIRAVMTMEDPARHHWSTTYCTAKVLVALWAIALGRRLSDRIAVHAVSPGNVPTTRAARNRPWYFRAMMGVAGVVGPAMGMATSASVGARRYLEATTFPLETSGAFYASPRGRLIGPLTRQDLPHLTNRAAAEACWRAVVGLTSEDVDDGRGELVAR
jgi:NAD(P)-dependent dehydrogenase (short-subunit alcohol dehydrogenase family)